MSNYVCPWWLGYFLASPFRRLIHDPNEILKNYVSQSMKVMDVGSAMGFFSLPLAQLVGEQGKVFCIDLQEQMIKSLIKRAERNNLHKRIETHICSSDSLGITHIKEIIDFALAFAMVHEVPNKPGLFSEINAALKSGGKLLIAEPKGHVSEEAFDDTIKLAQEHGFNIIERPKINKSHAVLLRKS